MIVHTFQQNTAHINSADTPPSVGEPGPTGFTPINRGKSGNSRPYRQYDARALGVYISLDTGITQ
jgi:hypothetical protein